MPLEPAHPAWLEFSDGRLHWLTPAPCTLGRGPTNTLVLDHPGVSRHHAVLQPDPAGGHLLADLRSTNGTHHNGLRLEHQVRLQDGDQIDCAGLVVTYRRLRAPAVADTTDTGTTSVQIHTGDCWLLMLDLIGHTAHTHAVGAATASADFRHWLELVRPTLARAGSTINAYLGDALFAYWRQDRQPAAAVRAALRELLHHQATSPRPFRIILHHGPVRLSGGAQGESLVGTDVIYLFRIEKSTKPLGARCVLSATAARSLELAGTARPLGSHPVPDYPGTHAFYALEA